MVNQFRIKIKKTSNINDVNKKIIIQKRFLLFFWESASRKDISTEKVVSWPSWLAHFESVEDAKIGIENWKTNLAINVLKVKVLKPISYT
jgi:hypothetical protein